jgi:hypothetical protein
MGPSQQKPVSTTSNEEFPKIAHEVFSNRQIIKNGQDEESILVKVAVPHQKEYLSWVGHLTKTGPNEALLLPKSHSFNKQGFCGLSGVVDVSLPLPRSTTKTTPSCCRTRSTIASAWAPSSSKKTSCGTWCSPC